MLTISDMLGVPRADQPAVAKAAEKLFSMSDDEYSSLEERAADTINEIMLLSATGVELAKFRRNNPGDDLMTSIVNAEVDGHRLTDEEIGAFLILLASAGNDTTKQTTTHAMMALADNPDQRTGCMEDFENRIGPAVEEFVRWASPVLQFARFATEDTEIDGAAGRRRRQGRAVLLLGQPRRDGVRRSRDVRPAPLTQPAPRLRRRRPALLPRQPAGQGGAAKPVPRVADSSEDVEFGEPDLLHSNFVHGIKRLPARDPRNPVSATDDHDARRSRSRRRRPGTAARSIAEDAVRGAPDDRQGRSIRDAGRCVRRSDRERTRGDRDHGGLQRRRQRLARIDHGHRRRSRRPPTFEVGDQNVPSPAGGRAHHPSRA